MRSSCPSCGGALSFPERSTPLVSCGSCTALVVRLPSGVAAEAVPFAGESTVPVPGRLVALICRLCGGPWPEQEAAPRPADRCRYCGQPASESPGVLAALRLLTRHPTRAPAPLRRLGLFWLTSTVAVLLVLLLGLLRPARGLSFEETLALPPGLSAASGVVPLDVGSGTIHVGRRSRAFPYLAVQAPDLRDGRLCVHVRLRHPASGRAASGWLTLWDGEPLMPGYPAHHPWAELALSGRRVLPLPAGEYRVELTAAAFAGSAPPASVTVELRTMAEPANGFLILLLNAWPWLLVWDLRANAGRLVAPAPSSRVARGLFVVVAAVVLLEQLAPLNPFGARGILVQASGVDPETPPFCGNP